MNKYKLIFVRNEIISCDLMLSGMEFKGDYYCEHNNGMVIFAIVKADNIGEAINKGANILVDFVLHGF